MLLRSRFDPESADPEGELFASAVTTFISAIIRPKGEQGVSAADRFAIIKTAADRDASDGGDPDEEGMSARICDAALAAYEAAEANGLDPRSVQLTDIATSAGCSTTTVERHWGGPSLLLIEFFYSEIDQYPLPDTALPLGESIDRLSAAALSVLDEPESAERDAEFLRMIGRMLFETARFGAERPLLAGAALPTIEFGGPDGSRAHLRNERDVRLRRGSIASRFERVIDAGQQSGVLRDERGLDAPDLGNLLPVTVLHQAIRRDPDKAREVAEMVYETILRGLVSNVANLPSSREATRQPIPEPGTSTA
jgi:AcrR family transcriptional regulator